MEFLLYFVVWLALCFVAAYLAKSRGRSAGGIFLLSFFLSPLVGMIVAAALPLNFAGQGKKKCPNCAEFVQPDARVCRFCQASFVESDAAIRAQAADIDKKAAVIRRLQVQGYRGQELVNRAREQLGQVESGAMKP